MYSRQFFDWKIILYFCQVYRNKYDFSLTRIRLKLSLLVLFLEFFFWSLLLLLLSLCLRFLEFLRFLVSKLLNFFFLRFLISTFLFLLIFLKRLIYTTRSFFVVNSRKYWSLWRIFKIKLLRKILSSIATVNFRFDDK